MQCKSESRGEILDYFFQFLHQNLHACDVYPIAYNLIFVYHLNSNELLISVGLVDK